MENANNLKNQVKTEEKATGKGSITKASGVETATKEVEAATSPVAKRTVEEHKIIKEEVVAEMPEVISIEETSEQDNNNRLNKMKKQMLCKLVKNSSLKKHPDEYQELVSDATYICLKCGRVAKDKSSLCKPKLMKSTQKQL
jgi:hypothetical protein